MAERKDEQEIKAILADEIRNAIAYDASDLSDKRARAIEYYFGEMRDTPPVPNRSKVVSRDVADVIGWVLPGIMRTFLASGRIAEYEPVEPGDEEGAEQASDYIHHVFMRDNDGYRVIYNATHDSLLQANGIVKHWWEKAEEYEVSEHTGLMDDALAILVNDDDVEVEESIERQKTGEDGQPYVCYDVRIRRRKRTGRLRIEAIQPDHFLMNKDVVTLEDFRFCCHYDDTRTRSDLIAMGYDRDLVDGLSSDDVLQFSEEELARTEDKVGFDDSRDRATDIIPIYECYLKVDVDGDGIAETIRAMYAGNAGSGELLEWKEWEDEAPFTDIPCEPVPHRWDGRSLSDNVMDMQQVKTVLLRQLLDNTYNHAMPQPEVEQGAVLNEDALVSKKFGAPIMKRPGSAPINWHDMPFIGGELLAVMQHVDAIIEKRTGVSRATMALDPEALQNQTATAVQRGQDAAYSKIELIARNMAELGWKKVFRKLLKLVIRHQDAPRMIRLRNQWVSMDPRHWNADMDCTVNVGLGTGSRDRDMAMLNALLQQQVMMLDRMFAGVNQAPTFGIKALQMLPKVVNTLVKIGESAGIRNADDYYIDFTPEDLQQIAQEYQQAQENKPEDPKIALEREKAQIKQQSDAAKLGMQQQEAAQDAQLEQARMERELAAEIRKQDMEFQLRERQMEFELRLKERQLAAELAMKERMGMMNMASGMATTPVRVGGEPG